MPEGTTKSEANEELGKVEKQVRYATYVPVKEIPKFKELSEQWHEVKVSSGIRHTTLKQYKGHIENHLNPYFEDVKTNQINVVMVERFIKHLTDNGVHANTIRKILTTLSSIMKYAAHPKRGYAPYNPVPDAENKPEKIKQEADMITVEECTAIMDKMSYARDKLMVLTGALGGLRLGEIFGLQRDDIQSEDLQIFIRRTFNHGRFYPPKTKTSVRLVDMDDWYFEALKMWQQICPPSKENMVFSTHTENGRPMDSTSWVRRIWHPARKAAGVRYLTPKSLRHFSGSYLLDQGESVGYVQDHLGHASSQMTTEVYRHKLRKQNRRAA